MQIHLKDLALKGQAVHLTEDMDVSSVFEGRKDIVQYGPLHVDLHVNHEAGTVEVGGTLTVDLELSCSRCLTHFKETVELPFQEVFTQIPVEQEEDSDIHVVTEDKVDLRPYLEENLVMGLPYIPLCSEACKGLCPVCGENRNVRDCGCKQDKIDPRLAGLADFFKE
jgi:uncharacterized protein